MHHMLQIIGSISKFIKASMLSLIIIGILFGLMTLMGQGLTMVVEMMEQEPIALLLTLLYVNLLALMLSHYPIYTYMAADINNSGDHFIWKRYNMFGPLLRWIPIYNFEENPDSSDDTLYKPDRNVHYFRYFLGFLVYMVWAQILVNSYSANLRFNEHNLSIIFWTTHLSSIIPILVYRHFYEKISTLEDGQRKGKILKNLTIAYLGFAIVGFTLIAMLLIFDTFSLFGLYLLLTLNFVMLFNFVFFRLLRKRFDMTLKFVNENEYKIAHLCLRTIKPLALSENYLRLFMVGFIFSLLFVAYCIIVAVNGGQLINGLPILMAYLYCYSYIIATLAKFFLVCRRNSPSQVRAEGANSGAYKLAFWSIAILALMFSLRFVTPIKTHELEQVCAGESVEEEKFSESLMNRGDTLFFIAAHGGGLKANIWTLNLMYTLDTITKGEMLRQSAAMSGASGGSLGLALYAAISGECAPTDTEGRSQRIKNISEGNYTSLDLTMLMGPDFYRKLWPFNNLGGSRDRAYYAMLRYQNLVEGNTKSPKTELSKESFRSFWQKIYNSRDSLFPSLIMNTAASNGQRGIIWSLKSEHFNSVFPNAQNLGDLQGGARTLSYYQGVSMTNRFPLFSPAAKVSGYGHYIDAGTIDNSGILGCLDYYNALRSSGAHIEAMRKKTIVFVEIVNSRSIYIRKLIEDFERENGALKVDVNESPSLITDLITLTNVDKISDYLSSFLQENDRRNPKFHHVRILLPHRISIEDIEAFLSGEILNPSNDDIRNKLKCFLRKHNATINSTIKNDPSMFVGWKCLEPELSRHFSQSNLNYVQAILKHPSILEQFERVKKLAPPHKRN